jgi:hypothetical protein
MLSYRSLILRAALLTALASGCPQAERLEQLTAPLSALAQVPSSSFSVVSSSARRMP